MRCACVSPRSGGRSEANGYFSSMGIKERIEDAKYLWQQGRKEGAWIMALIATAATARKRYPRPMNDNESFKSFIQDIAPIIMLGKGAPKKRIRMMLGETLLGGYSL